ncbi:MAG: hypothetical protein GY899_08045 [Verrucomicrobiaceae bacterium]|nr:hypothetical protein [Verrucomicrobiaceae bacterium]
MKEYLLKDGFIIAAVIAVISLTGCNKDQPAQAGATKEAEPAKESEPAEDKVSAALEGKLIGLKDGGIAEAKLTGRPEYYVLYHSASW